MKDNKNIKKKEITSDVGRWVIIIVCFLLAILDMIMLRDALGKVIQGLGSNAMKSLTAFVIATVANFNAFLWGMETGRNLRRRSVNKNSVLSFCIWVVIGIFYIIVKISSFDDNILNNLVELSLLMILYASTGLTISAEARVIFDRDVREYKRLQKQLELYSATLADEVSEIRKNLDILDGFEDNFKTLDDQYAKIKSTIKKSEESAMADIVGKMLAGHPEVTPSEAHKVMDEMLAKREKEN